MVDLPTLPATEKDTVKVNSVIKQLAQHLNNSPIPALPVTVANGGTGLASGTSGGIPYYSATTTMASSAALADDTIVVGGGAGAAPSTPGTTPPTISSTGVVTVPNATAATSKTTGAAIFSGGLGVAKDSHFGGQLVVNANAAAINSWSGIINNVNVQYQGVDGSACSVTFDTAGTGVTNIFAFRRMRGTAASPTAVQANDGLGAFFTYGYDGSAFSSLLSSGITFTASENWSSTAHGTFFGFYTTPNGTTTFAEAMRVNASGGLSVGTTTDSGIGAVLANKSVTAHNATSIPSGGTAGAGFLFSSTANFGIFFGSGAPSLSAAKGSLYLRSDGSSTTTRAYVNTDGGTTWTSITTAA